MSPRWNPGDNKAPSKRVLKPGAKSPKSCHALGAHHKSLSRPMMQRSEHIVPAPRVQGKFLRAQPRKCGGVFR
jgi:hypothetical protein